MDSVDLFMDVERFVKWTYENKNLAYREQSDYDKWSKATVQKWRRYETLPLEKLKEINDKHLLSQNKPFKVINIADLMLCCTLAKDHNRGKADVESNPITSTGRKVLMLFLLGRMLNNDSKENSPFTVKKSDDEEKTLYDYLISIGNGNDKGGQEMFYYYPGRTVSHRQLCKLGKAYKNNITTAGVMDGLADLVSKGLVICVSEADELYKLSFDGCFEFLELNKRIE